MCASPFVCDAWWQWRIRLNYFPFFGVPAWGVLRSRCGRLSAREAQERQEPRDPTDEDRSFLALAAARDGDVKIRREEWVKRAAQLVVHGRWYLADGECDVDGFHRLSVELQVDQTVMRDQMEKLGLVGGKGRRCKVRGFWRPDGATTWGRNCRWVAFGVKPTTTVADQLGSTHVTASRARSPEASPESAAAAAHVRTPVGMGLATRAQVDGATSFFALPLGPPAAVRAAQEQLVDKMGEAATGCSLPEPGTVAKDMRGAMEKGRLGRGQRLDACAQAFVRTLTTIAKVALLVLNKWLYYVEEQPTTAPAPAPVPMPAPTPSPP